MPVILDKASISRWLAEIRLWPNGSELLRAGAEDCVRLRRASRRIDTTGEGDDDPTLLDEVTAWWAFGPAPGVVVAGRET
jgi:putative SOS response-associated peptidase YedK